MERIGTRLILILYLMASIHCVMSLIEEFEFEPLCWWKIALYAAIGLICIVRSLQLIINIFKTIIKEMS